MKRIRFLRYSIAAAVCMVLGGYCAQFPFRNIYRLESSDIKNSDAIAVVDGFKEPKMISENFLGIPVRSAGYIPSSDTVVAGGSFIGLALKSKGLRIVGSQFVETKIGEINTLKQSDVRQNDLLVAVNGSEVNSQDDVARVLSSFAGDCVQVKLLRGSREITTQIGVARNIYDDRPSLGLWVKDHLSGVGTLTYTSGNRFAALGHAVKDETAAAFPTKTGSLYPCELLGVQQGGNGVPGYIKGTFSYHANCLGAIEKNNDFGIYGTVSDALTQGVQGAKTAIECCARQEVKLGKAQILSAVSGRLQTYNIEIIKASNQKKPQTKSMVIRVVDPDLIAMTGGIVQGMSGSPIIQNGKFVGAVTHVFNSDATKGFALYGDWMLYESNRSEQNCAF